MTTLVNALAEGGTLRPAEVLEIALAEKLDIACAAVMLEKESGGGRNVWGHDPVQTGGAYVKGAEVTRTAYEAYRKALVAGNAGPQGVGPCQLTWHGYQDQADKLGGCWDWRVNCTVGFRALAGHIRAYGERDGFRRYNGAGKAAELYADNAMIKLAAWRIRIGKTLDAAGILPTLRVGDSGEAVRVLQAFMIRTFPDYAKYTATGLYGASTQASIAEFQRRARVQGSPLDGSIVGPATNAALAKFGYGQP